jgi:hypothetical protein
MMLIPGLMFCMLILPTIWFSSRDIHVQSIWRQLNHVVVARAFIVLFLVGSLLIEKFVDRGFIVLEIAAAINLAILLWSFYRLGQLATRLRTRELSTLSSRTMN